jgi:uncharacterized protein YciI
MSKPGLFAGLMLLFIAGIAAAQFSKPSLFVVHFETGPAWNKALAPAEQPAFKEHSANLNQLRKSGAITFGARYEQLGMIFLEAESIESAKAILDADPGVKAGTFIYRVAALSVFYPWQE